MIVTAWKNGQFRLAGVGFGVRIKLADRDRYFRRDWSTVILEFEGSGKVVEVNVGKKSFWDGKCRELIHQEIGRWFFQNGLAPWPRGKPPKLNLEPLGERRFVLRTPKK